MSECKKLRISEIRKGVFIVERYDFGNPGKWVELNMKGEEKQDVFTVNGLIVIRDESEYKDLKEAESAMKDFILFPRVVVTHETESFPVYHMDEIIVDKYGDRVTETRKTPIEVNQFELFVNEIKAIEEKMNLYAESKNWQPIKVSITEVNQNLENPI